MRLDYHTHTTASDGQYSPDELITMAKKLGLELIAVTDHDTIEGIEEARIAAKREGITFVPGIEISTYLEEEIHMLGLGIDDKNPKLKEACDRFMEERRNRGQKISEFLLSKGVSIDLEEVKEYAGFGSLGRPHFAWALQKHGHVTSVKEAFERYLNTREFHEYTDRKKPTPQEGIQLIHEAGGKAVLAHPGLLKMGKDRQRQLIEELTDSGLDGLETYYSQYTKKQTRFYRELAEQLGLGMTAGSDFHGEKVKKTVALGMNLTTAFPL